MRDISTRINRYRLSRYAPPEDRVRRRLRWAWLLAALWLVWFGFVSDHSLYRIWSLSRENGRTQQKLAGMREEIGRLDAQLSDPRAGRDLAERALREKNGMARPGEIVYRIHSRDPDSLAH